MLFVKTTDQMFIDRLRITSRPFSSSTRLFASLLIALSFGNLSIEFDPGKLQQFVEQVGHEKLLDLELLHVVVIVEKVDKKDVGVEVMVEKADVDKEVEHVEGSLVLNQSIGFHLAWPFLPSLSCSYVTVKMPIEERLKE